MSSKRITGLTERTTLASGDYFMLDNASLGSGKFDATKLAEPPWELLNDITLTEESEIDLTADSNGTPYNLLGVYICISYPANTLSASSGYSRFQVRDENGNVLQAETGKYTQATFDKFKHVHLNRIGNLSIMKYIGQTAIGTGGTWQSRAYGNGYGALINFGHVVRIFNPTNDVEPAGTRIRIYGQRAYS